MAEVVVSVNKRNYSVACDDGQEPHLRKLAAALDKRVEQLAEQMGQIGDQRLLLMAGLLLADELYELESQLHRATAALEHDAAGREAAGITALAERVEALAARVEADAG
ncbi:MAG: cell division protein ZapA [Alphaproteobacteria bacterium]